MKQFIEHCDECKAAFLRGFFDSEGSVNKNGKILAINSSYELLKYVKKLLADLGIESTGPHLKIKEGTYFKSGTTGKIYQKKSDIYYLYVRMGSLFEFYRKIGFIITRKQKRLEEALKKKGLL